MNKDKNDKISFPKEQWTYKPFSYVFHELADLLCLLKMNPDKIQTLSISCLNANVRLLEAIANTILAEITMGNDLAASLDRLRVLEKFELALLFRQVKSDFNFEVLPQIKMLIKQRNLLIHAKVIEANIISLKQGQDNVTFFATDTKRIVVSAEEVKIYLMSTFKFLDAYFAKAKLEKEQVRAILFDCVSIGNGSEKGVQLPIQFEKDKEAIENSLEIEIKFV